MIYTADLEPGRSIKVESQGEQTRVSLSSSHAGSSQSQSSSFDTGAWSQPPTLHRDGGGFLLRVQTKRGTTVIRIDANRLSLLDEAPRSQGEQISLSASDEPANSAPAMEPMKPMEPMRMGDMEMRPGEMRMGNMRMSLNDPVGEAPSVARSVAESIEPERVEEEAQVLEPSTAQKVETRRFCTQCGQRAQSEDRFCGSCGHPLGAA